MGRERLACRPATGEAAHRRGCRRLLGRNLVLGGVGLQLLELQLHLVEQPRLALAALAIELTPQLLDGEPRMGDQRVLARPLRPRLRQLGVARAQQLLQRLDVVRKGLIVAHALMESQAAELVSPMD